MKQYLNSRRFLTAVVCGLCIAALQPGPARAQNMDRCVGGGFYEGICTVTILYCDGRVVQQKMPAENVNHCWWKMDQICPSSSQCAPPGFMIRYNWDGTIDYIV